MGMFDTVFVWCPHCGERQEIQTKDGPCTLGEYNLCNAPPAVLLGIEGEHECVDCGGWFHITVQHTTQAFIEAVES
jgi:hypothetical protein